MVSALETTKDDAEGYFFLCRHFFDGFGNIVDQRRTTPQVLAQSAHLTYGKGRLAIGNMMG